MSLLTRTALPLPVPAADPPLAKIAHRFPILVWLAAIVRLVDQLPPIGTSPDELVLVPSAADGRALRGRRPLAGTSRADAGRSE